MTEPGFAGLVIRRSPDREERQLRLSKIYAILAVATLAAVVIGVAVSIGIAMYSGPGFASVGWELALPCGLAVSTIIAVQSWRVEGRLAGLELSITEEGVTYRSVAGAFPAPWSAVRRTVARAVHHLSDGRITVTSPAFKDP